MNTATTTAPEPAAKFRKFSMTEVLRQSVGIRRAASCNGAAVCAALVNNTGAAGALDACAYAFRRLAMSGRIPDCIPSDARETARLIAAWTSELGHASISAFEDKIRAHYQAQLSATIDA